MAVKRLRRYRRAWPAATCAALVCAFALTGGASAQTVGGIADVGADFEPPCLNPYQENASFTCFGLATRSKIASLALPGAYRLLPDLTYEPMLVQSVAVGRSTLTYQLKANAEWNDDVPVSADDLIFTFQTIMNPANEIASRDGYDRITQAVKVDAKTVRFVFSKPYAPWRSLFPHVLPKHVLEGRDFDTIWNNVGTEISDPDTNLPIGAGPFLVTNWVNGDRIELARNPNWWGPHLPYLDGLVFRFYSTPSARITALTSGAVELIDEAFLNTQGADLYDDPGIVADWYAGSAIDHIFFRTTSTTMPLLQQRWFREAVAYALDRSTAVSAVYGALAPGMAVHQSLLYLGQQSEYKPNFARYQYNTATVASIMTSHACSLGVDDIWVCPDTSDPGLDPDRASLRFATATGNAQRAHMQEELRVLAEATGIELVPDNSSGNVLFGTRLPAGDFDLIMFTFVVFGDPFGRDDVYGCGGSQNYMGFCSPSATALLRSSNQELSTSYRAFLVNRAESNLAGSVPALPLFQRPQLLAHRDELHGVVASAALVGATWNAEDWYLEPDPPAPPPPPPPPPPPRRDR